MEKLTITRVTHDGADDTFKLETANHGVETFDTLDETLDRVRELCEVNQDENLADETDEDEVEA